MSGIPRIRALPGLLAAGLLQGCIVVPQTVPQSTIAYDEECKVLAKQWTLKSVEIGRFGGCSQRDCIYLLMGMGIVAASSLVVSGSIVVIGNTVHWLEKQGKCWTK